MRQNTKIATEGTVEEQFKQIQAEARQDALNDIELLKPLTDDQLKELELQDSQVNTTTEQPQQRQIAEEDSPASSSDPSSFELLSDHEYAATHAVPRDPERQLPLPEIEDIEDLLTDDDSDANVSTTHVKGTLKTPSKSKKSAQVKDEQQTELKEK